MPYMEAIVLEGLRMFSGRAFTVPHRALRDTTLGGYIIPKVGCHLVFCVKSALFCVSERFDNCQYARVHDGARFRL